MSDRTDIPGTAGAGIAVSRRDAIRKGLVLGSVGYVAPMILGSATSASAQPVSGSGCASATPTCNPEAPEFVRCLNEDCVCAQTTEGMACVQAVEPSPDHCGCPTSATCPDGWFCIDLAGMDECDFVINTICGGDATSICLPPCGTVR